MGSNYQAPAIHRFLARIQRARYREVFYIHASSDKTLSPDFHKGQLPGTGLRANAARSAAAVIEIVVVKIFPDIL